MPHFVSFCVNHNSNVINSFAADSSMTGVDEGKRVLDPGEAEFNPKGKMVINRPPADHLSRKRFGEPQEQLEAEYSASTVGVYAKIGHTTPQVVAQAGNIILVDAQKFVQSTKFVEDITATWMQGGDLACLLQPWTHGDSTVLVRRQTCTDGRNVFSGPIELFVVKSCVMPERHVIWFTHVNALFGYFQTNPSIKQPEIKLWLSNRRGVPCEGDTSDYLEFVAQLSSSIGVLDVVKSPLCNFSGLMSNDEFSAINTVDKGEPSPIFEAIVLDLKPDYAMDNGMVVFLTLWRQVWACKLRSAGEYHRALLANCVHRTFYEFERFLFELKATVEDVMDHNDILLVQQMVLDYVSLFSLFTTAIIINSFSVKSSHARILQSIPRDLQMAKSHHATTTDPSFTDGLGIYWQPDQSGQCLRRLYKQQHHL